MNIYAMSTCLVASLDGLKLAALPVVVVVHSGVELISKGCGVTYGI